MLQKLSSRLNSFLHSPSLVVYVACKMTMRDKGEMVERAQYVTKVFSEAGITVISPVIREEIRNETGNLVNRDEEALQRFWANDKHIIRREAHAVVLDLGEMKSFGMEREYMLSRGVLWKPTVMILGQGVSVSVAKYEDDAIYYSVHKAAMEMARMWGSRWNRWMWRTSMIRRSLPKRLLDEVFQWR